MIPENFWLFAFTALLLNLTPGNDMLFVMTRSASQGSKAGLVSSLGIMVGCMVHMFAALAGLSAVIAKSAIAFSVIKYAGAVYLIYLGVRSFMDKNPELHPQDGDGKLSLTNIFWQGVITNVLNPKVALFFLAFLPQFVQTGSGRLTAQILFLGVWFNLGGTVVNSAVALLFGRIGRWLSKSAQFVYWQKRTTGLVLIVLGIKVAFSTKK